MDVCIYLLQEHGELHIVFLAWNACLRIPFFLKIDIRFMNWASNHKDYIERSIFGVCDNFLITNSKRTEQARS
jgi:hypothetical protein